MCIGAYIIRSFPHNKRNKNSGILILNVQDYNTFTKCNRQFPEKHGRWANVGLMFH